MGTLMFGLSEKEKFQKQVLSALSSFLVMYPGRLDAAHKAFPRLKTQELDMERRPAWHAQLIARELFTRVIDTTMTQDERLKIGRQLDSLDMTAMRQWTVAALGGQLAGNFPGLHPATVYIATAECVADLFHLGQQFDKVTRDEFSMQINQALVGMTKEQRDQDRIERAINMLGEDEDGDENHDYEV